MKKVMTGFFIFMISLCLFVAKLDADTILPFSITEIQPQITMDLRDASLKDVLKILSIQAGMNFVAADTVQDRRLTVYLDKVTLKSAMDKLFSANSLTYDYDKEANIFIVKDWGRLGVETVTRVFHLKYASVSTSQMRSEKTTAGISSSSDSSSTTSSSSSSSTTSGDIGSGTITDVIKGIVSKDGSVVEDCRTNSLIISDIPSRMPIIAKTIEELDLPTPQVVLEVEMLDVSKNIIDTIGFKFGQTPFTAVVTGATAPLGFPFGSWMSTFANEANRGSIAINSGTNTYQVQLDWLRKNVDTRYLARPRILTLNNETAEIKITTQETIGQVSVTSTGGGQTPVTTVEAERQETGVTLRVTPQIYKEAGEITMFIVPTVKDTVASEIQSASYKDPEERSTKSTVRVKDGETVVLGGLIRKEKSQTITKLPILGDIPVLGALFRHKDMPKYKERELLVFITPRIVKDSASEMKLAQTRPVPLSLPVREQNASSGMGRDLVIDSSLSNFESKRK